MAAVHDDAETACGAPIHWANAVSNAIVRGPCTRIGPFRTSRTAARSASPISGRPNGIFRVAGRVPGSATVNFCNFDHPSLAQRAIDCKTDRHSGEYLIFCDCRRAFAENRVDEARYQVSLVDARVGRGEDPRRHDRVAAFPDQPRFWPVLERRSGPIKRQTMEMRID